MEKGIATHCNILACSEEPGGLQSVDCKESDMTERLNDNNSNSCPVSALGTTHTAVEFQAKGTIQGDTAGRDGKRSPCVFFGFNQKHSFGVSLGYRDIISFNV